MYGDVDISHQYPPELLDLLVEAIPRLKKSKEDVLIFFRGAGVPESLFSDISAIVHTDRDSIKKFHMVRTILKRINDKGEPALRERREILKRVIEYEDFTGCYENDRPIAIGLVAQISKIVNLKDAVTRIDKERKAERQERMAQREKELGIIRERRESIEGVKKDLFALFSETNTHKRGLALEPVLNKLFDVYGILIRESFKLRDNDTGTTLEQIDGVIEIDGTVYLVEMKWWDKPIGKAEVSSHLVRVFVRSEARCIFISASEYTEPAIATCKDALHQKVVVLCLLQEIIYLLEKEGDLKDFLKQKVRAAIVDKNPFKMIG